MTLDAAASVGQAAATVSVVVAAFVRQRTLLRRRHRHVDRELSCLRREVRELRDRLDRWTHLP